MQVKNEKLETAFTEFSRLPFPKDSDNEELSELHAELVMYDSFIAGNISAILDNKQVTLATLKSNHKLKIHLTKLANDGSLEAKNYLKYLDELDKLINLALDHASSVTN